MLSESDQREILNDFFSWSGGDLPTDRDEVVEYMLASYCLPYSDVEATAYLISEILTC